MKNQVENKKYVIETIVAQTNPDSNEIGLVFTLEAEKYS